MRGYFLAVAVFVVVFCGNQWIRAAEPLFETTRVFALTPDNKPNYRIPAILQAPDKSIIIFAEKRNDGPGDIGNHDVVINELVTGVAIGLGRASVETCLAFDPNDDKRVSVDELVQGVRNSLRACP